MKIKTPNSKVHQVVWILEDGTKITRCHRAMQTPFVGSITKQTNYGDWNETDEPVTCRQCLKDFKDPEESEWFDKYWGGPEKISDWMYRKIIAPEEKL